MKKQFMTWLLAITTMSAFAQQATVTGPDSFLKVNVSVKQGIPVYSVTYKDKTILEDSPLGFIANVGDFSRDMTFTGQKENKIDKTYTQDRIKQSQIHYQANELTCTFTNKEKKNIKSRVLSIKYSCKSFKPIVFENSQILILGTMPGKESLMTGEYYASSSNSFWKIIETIYNNGNKFMNYKEKVSCLKKNHISLWDVYGQCDRKGSLDLSISNEVLNDIDAFLSEHSSIKRIVFNGRKAALAYLPKIRYSVLCSTSNSNSRLSFAGKVEEWKKCLKE